MTRKGHVVCLGLVAVTFALAGLLYPYLPDPVPTHWNIHGVADGFTPKPWGAFVLPLVTAAVYLLLAFLPRTSPHGYRVERFGRVYGLLNVVLVAGLSVLAWVCLLSAAGAPLPIARVLPALVGALVAVLGNFMGKLTKNFFLGIRTPWTLASDEVWARTHRLGGRLMVAAGLVCIVASLAGLPALGLGAIIGAALVPVLYSYLIYRRLEGSGPAPQDLA